MNPSKYRKIGDKALSLVVMIQLVFLNINFLSPRYAFAEAGPLSKATISMPETEADRPTKHYQAPPGESIYNDPSWNGGISPPTIEEEIPAPMPEPKPEPIPIPEVRIPPPIQELPSADDKLPPPEVISEPPVIAEEEPMGLPSENKRRVETKTVHVEEKTPERSIREVTLTPSPDRNPPVVRKPETHRQEKMRKKAVEKKRTRRA